MTKVAKPTSKATESKPQAQIGLKVKFGGYSCAGVKAENQDAFAALVPKKDDLISKGAIACIADGVSSADKAAEASQMVVTQFISDYYSTPPTWSTQKSAAKVITSLNQWLYSQKSSALDEEHYLSAQRQQWLTTFTSMIFKSATGYIFHVGDTRITLYRNKQLETLSQDHNCKQGHKSVILTRALGADSRLQVDVHQVSLQTNDIYLLTCDGVHEFLTKKQVTTLLNTLSSEPDNLELEQLSKALVEQALAAGSDDNVSCLIFLVKNLPNKQLAEIETELRKKAIPPVLEVGQTLDSFKIKNVIHASTRSHVYLVEDTNTGETLTLKTPSANFTEDAYYLQAFFREAWLGERINHVNVMATKAQDNNSKFLYLVSEYIDGQTLTQWMYDNPKPSIGQVRDIIKQIISALRAFKRLEIVHRDLKPDNIMIDQYGQIKLIDYGAVFVASLDEDQETLAENVPQGTINYIAPETLLTMKADHLSDLFSLGVICYEMLTGELPYKPNARANNSYTTYQQWHYRSINHHRSDLPLWLDLTLQQATEADPRLRSQAFSEFYVNLTKPNIEAIDEYKSQPLMQRNPVQFWKGTSSILFVLLMVSLLY